MIIAFGYAAFYLLYFGNAIFLIKNYSRLNYIQFGQPRENKGVISKRLKDLPGQSQQP